MAGYSLLLGLNLRPPLLHLFWAQVRAPAGPPRQRGVLAPAGPPRRRGNVAVGRTDELRAIIDLGRR
eukprot:CAMPEP_0177272374 /NCGR_PEP_ID=MMETSP0367-20130122/66044_1 /TAXON_ID=447022 ORGANISM="Scrippsiella hangoei-like, Strain SHHI-4" /NCGR_SAMPLE_ID=MMETSP0367 /ASSEMBLY_ACC=CAM_ASM_000362 /LENGTH=66 /DNA_ID=CAMNT_0018728527 /DNA_START=90 /DNA_END=286 /DNA_ORIENTATION=-